MSSRSPQAEAIGQGTPEPTSLRATNDLLIELQRQNPELAIEDAFIVPSWFVHQTSWLEDAENSDSAIYNYPILFRIRGPLDQDILRRGLDEIVRRHQVLRSIFRQREGALVQIVVAARKETLPIIELTDLPDTESEGRIRQLCFKEARRPFDLRRDCLLRRTLIRIDPRHHLLQLTTHHLVYDDWSSGILARELSAHYQTLAAGLALPLDYVPFQYGDYVRWLEEQLKESSPRFVSWEKELVNTGGFKHLAPDFARPVKTTNHGACETTLLPTELADSLKALSRRERVSLFMVLLAGFKSLLHRYSGGEEIGIASCAANRPLPQVEGLIGRFGNDIFLRTSFSNDPTFRELLGRMREVALNAYADQGLPFGQILKATAATASNLPFQVMFILQNANREHQDIPGLSIEPFPFHAGTAKYDLTVLLKVEPTIEVTLEYKTELFRPGTMQQLLENYRFVLQKIGEEPAARVSSLVLPQPLAATTEIVTSGIADASLSNKAAPPDTEARLLELWSAALQKDITPDRDFFELGGDSLLATRLFARIEKTFGLRLSVSTLLQAATVRQLAAIIDAQSLCNVSLVPIQPRGAKPPLFCVHGHLGEVLYGRSLSHALGPDQPLFGFRSRGLAGESPFHTVREMAACYLQEVQTLQPTGPYYLSGWCFGGMIAFEMASLLRKEGEQVALLLLLNTPAPGSLDGWPLTRGYLKRRIGHELKKLGALGVRQKLSVFGAKTLGLARLSSGSFKTAFYRYFTNGYAAEKMKHSLSVADINVAAAKSYQPEVYPGGITMFLTSEARLLYDTDPAEGWSGFAQKEIELHSAAGDNQSLFGSPHVEDLAEKLESCLARAQAR